MSSYYYCFYYYYCRWKINPLMAPLIWDLDTSGPFLIVLFWNCLSKQLISRLLLVPSWPTWPLAQVSPPMWFIFGFVVSSLSSLGVVSRDSFVHLFSSSHPPTLISVGGEVLLLLGSSPPSLVQGGLVSFHFNKASLCAKPLVSVFCCIKGL